MTILNEEEQALLIESATTLANVQQTIIRFNQDILSPQQLTQGMAILRTTLEQLQESIYTLRQRLQQPETVDPDLEQVESLVLALEKTKTSMILFQQTQLDNRITYEMDLLRKELEEQEQQTLELVTEPFLSLTDAMEKFHKAQMNSEEQINALRQLIKDQERQVEQYYSYAKANELVSAEIKKQVETLETLYNKAKDSLEKQIQEIEQKVTDGKLDQEKAQTEINALNSYLAELLQEYNHEKALLAEKATEKTHILTHETLAPFYMRVQKKIREIFLAYQVIDSGLVAGKMGGSAQKAAAAIQLAGELIPLPFAIPITRWAAYAVRAAIWAANKKENKDIDKSVEEMADFVVTFEELDRLAEGTARKLTLMYEIQISLLSVISAGTFAEVAVKLMIVYLWEGGTKTEEEKNVELMDQLISAVANIQVAQDNVREGWFEKIRAHCEGLKDLFKTDPSLTQKNGDKSWTALGAFYCAGIKVPLSEPAQENGAEMFALYYGQGTNPDKYKYRIGTLEEVERAGLIFKEKLSFRSFRNTNNAIPDRGVKPGHLSQAMINVETRTGNMQIQLELLQRQLQQEQARRIELEEKMAYMMQVLATLQPQAAIQLPANVNTNHMIINTPGAPRGNRNVYQDPNAPGSSSNTMKKK